MPSPPDEKRLSELEAKWLNGTITEEEAKEYAEWYNQGQDLPVQVPENIASSQDEHRLKMLRAINSQRQKTVSTPVRILRVAAAAAILIAVVVGVLFYRKKSNVAKPELAQTTPHRQPTDIPPGTTRATLTLSNGKTILLDPHAGSLVEHDSGVTITSKDSTLTYTGAQPNNAPAYNTLHTAVGEQYSITLADGTRVWLNAASTLRFPTQFVGNERRVKITGEAYFEVTKNREKPFRVSILPPAGRGAGGGQVEVLGTHFNINAYDNEAAIKTTLLEGSVKVTKDAASTIIKPGEQAVMSTHLPAGRQGSPLTIDHSPNLEQVMAWKNGSFNFNDADITTIMRQLERWYNIQVVYEGSKPTYLFAGGMPRTATLMEVLQILQVSKVHFKLEGRKLTVLP